MYMHDPRLCDDPDHCIGGALNGAVQELFGLLEEGAPRLMLVVLPSGKIEMGTSLSTEDTIRILTMALDDQRRHGAQRRVKVLN